MTTKFDNTAYRRLIHEDARYIRLTLERALTVQEYDAWEHIRAELERMELARWDELTAQQRKGRG